MAIDYPVRPKRVRLSVSLRADLVEWVRETAARDGVTLSAVVEAALLARQRAPVINIHGDLDPTHVKEIAAAVSRQLARGAMLRGTR